MSQQHVPMFIVDAFTSTPFAGNPAAVCLLVDPAASVLSLTQAERDTIFQRIAREMNLSETAFVTPSQNQVISDESNSRKRFMLQWFTPSVEVGLCGHATLGTAHALFSERPDLITLENGQLAHELVFETKVSGELTVKRTSSGMLEMSFPRGNPQPLDRNTSPIFDRNQDLLKKIFKALSLDAYAEDPLSTAIVDVQLCQATKKLFLEVSDESIVRACSKQRVSELLNIDFIDPLLKEKVRGISVTCVGTDRFDFVSRYFSPWNGIAEDPVNGSSHTALVVLYSRKLNKQKMLAYMCSERGGELEVELPENEPDRMLMRGHACTVLTGQLKQQL